MNDTGRPFGALTITEVARTLEASEATIRRYVRAGKLRAVKVGRRQLVLPEQLRRFLAGEAKLAA